MKRLRIDLIAAARPNFMKVAPLFHALRKEPWCQLRLVHTGQHSRRQRLAWAQARAMGRSCRRPGGGRHPSSIGRRVSVH